MTRRLITMTCSAVVGLLASAIAVGTAPAAAASPTPSLDRSAVCFQTRGFTVVRSPVSGGYVGTKSVFGAWKGLSVVYVAVLPSEAAARRTVATVRSFLTTLVPKLTPRQLDAAIRTSGRIVATWGLGPVAYVGDVEHCIGLRGPLTNGEQPVGGRYASEAYALLLGQSNFISNMDSALLRLATACLRLGSPTARRTDSKATITRDVFQHPCAGYLSFVTGEYHGVSWWIGQIPPGPGACNKALRPVEGVEVKLAKLWDDVRFALTEVALEALVTRAGPLVAEANRARQRALDVCG